MNVNTNETPVTPAVMLVVKMGAEGALLLSSDIPNFEDLTMAVKGKFADSLSHEFTLAFQFNIDNLCKLNSQEDFKNMLMLVSMLAQNIVHIIIQVPNIQHQTPSSSNNPHSSTQPTSPVPPSVVRRNNRGILSPSFPPESPSPGFQFGGRTFRCVSNSSNSPNPPSLAFQFHQDETPTNNPPPYQTNNYQPPQTPLQSPATKKARAEKRARGEFFPGATTDFPTYDIAPQQEQVVLRSANWVNFITGVGQSFTGGIVEFRSKLVKYACKIGFRFKYSRNDAVYVKAYCKQAASDGCQWFIEGSVISVTKDFVIKKADLKHSCTLAVLGNDVERLGCRIIGDLITDAVRAKPSLTPTDLKQELLTYYGFDVPYDKVWRSVEVARANIFGTYDDSFDELRWYKYAIEKNNPGSYVLLESQPTTNCFDRFFVSFNASRQGFKKCRPLLFIDGTFMKTRYQGTILSATAKDGNNGLFPVAIAVVNGENSSNWTWFIQQIKDNITHPEEILFVSDRAGGLMHAFDAVYDHTLHFFCLFHLMKNLRVMYKGRQYSDIFKSTMCKLLSLAAYAPTKRHFNAAIRNFLNKGGLIAEAFLHDLPAEKWAIAFAPHVHRHGELTSNAAESFNNWILDARALPITFMIDCIRTQLMKWFSECRVEGSKWTGMFTETFEDKWNAENDAGNAWNIIASNQAGVFDVRSPTSSIVNLVAHACTCYQWQVRGFPCPHAIACIKRSRWELKDVIDECYFADTYMAIYSDDIFPIGSTEKYEFIDLNCPAKILPPVVRRLPGRPKKRRLSSTAEPRKPKFICGRCGKYGRHDWITCRQANNQHGG